MEGLVSDFHLLLQEQIPQLMRYAMALTRDAEEAGDLVEDAMHEALDYKRHLRGDIHVWLLTILHDLRGNPFRQMTLPTPICGKPGRALTLSDLDRALGQLPEEQRAAILLIGLEGLSYEDASAVLRVTSATLRSRLASGRANLRRLMRIEEVPHQTTRLRRTRRAA